jgi:hypothetical protein|tara:strand:- start:466 stop:687 length:222 start_codon:yes stop_codon:yes gene_type:complete
VLATNVNFWFCASAVDGVTTKVMLPAIELTTRSLRTAEPHVTVDGAVVVAVVAGVVVSAAYVLPESAPSAPAK